MANPLLVSLFPSLLLLTVTAIVATTTHHLPPHSNLIGSSCNATLYPHLCFSTLLSASPSNPINTPKDVIDLALNLTITSVQHNFFAVKKLLFIHSPTLTDREITALHDCLEMVDETLYELHKSQQDLHDYLTIKKSISEHADDLKTLLSAAMTNQQTCLDGFSHDRADKKVREELIQGQMHVHHMCSNVLAMIKNLTDTDMAKESSNLKKSKMVMEEERERKSGWPQWLSAGDRKLLQAPMVTANVTVAADGSGDFKTVSEAVAAAPAKSKNRYIIRIKAGVYIENVDVSKKKTNLMFVGDGRTTTIITGSRNVVDGSTTFRSATVGKCVYCFTQILK